MERMARSRRMLRCDAERLSSLLVRVVYFLVVSCAGYLLLTELKVRPVLDDRTPRCIDLFFTVVSAMMVLSMSTIEMEVFFSGQLLVMMVLMLVSGEVFISLVGLTSKWSKLRKEAMDKSRRVESHDKVEFAMPSVADDVADINNSASVTDETSSPMDVKRLQHNTVCSLLFIILAILVAVHALSAVAVAAYVVYASLGARRTLWGKTLVVWIFTVFMMVSTFSSCGYMPTNENMPMFRREHAVSTACCA